MPIRTHRARTAALSVAVAALGSLTLTSTGVAKSIPAELRVVDSNGEILAEQTQYTQTSDAFVRTDRKANCFGPGSGGSGKRAAVPGATALSQLLDARASDKDLKPVSVSDAFDFGLAVCGIGDAVSTQEGFLYLKQNHAGTQTGGDQTPLKKGDEFLWFLVENFEDPLPDELELLVKPTARPGSDIRVKVVSYDDAGKKTPAAGAEVEGADRPTDERGLTTLPADDALVSVQATREGSIPSNVEAVCTDASKCPAGYANRIGGTKGADRIEATKLADEIYAGGGDDRIDATAGAARDAIRCGGGDDTVKIAGSATAAELIGCEKVRGS